MTDVDEAPAEQGSGQREEALLAELAQRDREGAALRASEALFRHLAESSRDLMYCYRLTPAPCVEYVNPSVTALTGYSPEELYGDPELATTLIHPDDLPELAQKMQAALTDGVPVYMRWCRKDGSDVWTEHHVTPVLDDGGNVVGLRGVAQDVTERLRLENERTELLNREQVARAEAEAARRGLEFLAEASNVLAASLDYETTLASVAALAVPMLADWCAVDVVEADGSIRSVALTHADPGKEALIRDLWVRYPPEDNPRRAVPSVLETGRSELISEITDEARRSMAFDQQQLDLLVQIGTRSRMTVPLVARGRVLGAIILGSTDELRRYGQGDLTLAEDLARRCALAVDNARLYCEVQDALARREALVRAARRLGAEADPEQMLIDLLEEAMALVRGSAAKVFEWNASQQQLVATRAIGACSDRHAVLRPGQGAAGCAIEGRQAVILNEYQRQVGASTSAGRGGAQSAVAVPLLHEGRLLGALSVISLDPQRRFSEADAELLELLAGIAAAVLVGRESVRRAAELGGRLDGVVLAARELAHLVNNTLTLPVGVIELLLTRSDLPPGAHEMLEEASTDLASIERHVGRFQHVVRVETKETPIGPSLDLERSISKSDER